ncbi:MAG: phosphogluconate dehydratase [Hyphomonadaceae bacterium]
MHPKVREVTDRIIARSSDTRAAYLDMVRNNRPTGFARQRLTEGNLAHAAAACSALDKVELLGGGWPNLGMITAYNDMLSAHQPYEAYPEFIRQAARDAGATAQVAGGVPAMCDGVTQGQGGMELSLFSRDVIALSAAVGLSHNVFDAALFMGVCDKIVPGLFIGALRFGWLPAIFIPAGPMTSGLPNPEKVRVRQAFARGEVGRDELLKAEAESYHSAGTCTFYGTANSNQMLMECMGLHLPGAAFINPGTPLRAALTTAAVKRSTELIANSGSYLPVGEMIDARSVVNAIVGLMATGGSTNHALHLPAMAAAAGYRITLEDMADLSAVTPLLCRVYPNGPADVNHFHAAGGMGFLIRELIDAGLLDGTASTVYGTLEDQSLEPWLEDGELAFRAAPKESRDTDILRPASDPFSPEGGLALLQGPLGRGMIKVSAVKPEHQKLKAPARVFDTQAAVRRAFENGELETDVVVVVRFQGPAANGMPELHALSPVLGALQDAGHKVALVTDGRMSGASGKVPAAIHVSPEAARGGPLAYIRDGDIISLDAGTGVLGLEDAENIFQTREPKPFLPNQGSAGLGQEMFGQFRSDASRADEGASFFNFTGGSE